MSVKGKRSPNFVDEYFDAVPEWQGMDDPLGFQIVPSYVDADTAPSGRLPVVKLESWRLLSDLLGHKFFAFDKGNWVFRGHRRYDWSLSPTLGRGTDGIIREELANNQLERFKKAVRGRLKDNSVLLYNSETGSSENDDELWALGQHHGLHTPLLDWTHSPYVALFFAFDEDNKSYEMENPYRVIFALNKRALRNNAAFADIPIIEPKIDDHGRLVNQAGMFIKSPYGNTIENEIINILGENEIIDVDDADALAHYICKIYIRNEELTECRHSLHNMNIHHASLFPDLIGASNYCNAEVPNDNNELSLKEGSLSNILKIRMDHVPAARGIMVGDDEAEPEVSTRDDPHAVVKLGDALTAFQDSFENWTEDEKLMDAMASLFGEKGVFEVEPYLTTDDIPASTIKSLADKLPPLIASRMVTDWEHKESAQAAMRNAIRHLLVSNDVQKEKAQFIAKDIVANMVEAKRELQPIVPELRFKDYLLDTGNWGQAEQYISFYKPYPEFTIDTTHDDENERLAANDEWTRGEIRTDHNAAYWTKLFYQSTCIKKIHTVVFDDRKKTMVAPDWEAVGAGRIYFYRKDSLAFAYQQHLSEMYGEDFSHNLRKQGGGSFDIPVFEDENDWVSFKDFLGDIADQEPATDTDEQIRLFYELLDRYAEYRGQE